MGIQPTQKERYEYRLLQCFQEREDRSRRRAIGDQMDGATVMSASNQRTLLPEGKSVGTPHLRSQAHQVAFVSSPASGRAARGDRAGVRRGAIEEGPGLVA